MLVLMRRPGETIYVGDDITITVVSLEGQRVRLGVQAPREVSVDREEIYMQKRRGGMLEAKTMR